jgi:hypothetical protein
MDITQVEKIGEEIVEALTNAVGKMSNPEWTNVIKSKMSEIGKRHEFVVRSTTFGGEWLYDIVWCKKEGEYLKEVFLVCESELDTTANQLGAIRYDFQKLLQSSAPLRIMISQTYHDRSAAIFEDCKKGVEMCENMKLGDKVLVIVYDDNDGETYSEWIEKK